METPEPLPMPLTITIPDLVSYCDFPLSTNVHVDLCTPATDEWITSPCALSAKRKAAVTGIKAGTLASMAYPNADLPGLRICADYMHFLFHLDDLTDDMGIQDAKQVADVVMDVLHWPERYVGQIESGKAPALVQLTYDLWTRMLPNCGPNVQARFIETNNMFFQAVHYQSALRASGSISDMESYITLRRDDGGVKPSFVLIEYAAGSDLPDQVMDNPVVKKLENAANDLIVWSNDIFSFNKEQSRGDRNNLVIIAMEERGLSMQQAVDFIGELCNVRLHDFAEDRERLPTWGGDIDRDVQAYVQGLADWVVGSLHWSFISHRYFLDRGLEVKERRVVELLPMNVRS